MNQRLPILLLFLLAAGSLWAQEADTSRWQLHLTAGTEMASGYGHTQSISWVAPSFELHPNDRLTVTTGFAMAGSLMPAGYKLQGYEPRSLAPRRTGTQATAVWAEAEYQVNDRLWLWGAVTHIGGFVQPPWLDNSMPLQASSFSGGVGYRFGDRSILEMHFNITRDTYGTLAPLLYDDPFIRNSYF